MIPILLLLTLCTVLFFCLAFAIAKPYLKRTAHRLYPPYQVGILYRNRIIRNRLKKIA